MTIEELEAIALEATPGPWKAIGGKCLAGVVAPNCQIYLHDARSDMFNSLPRWQATAVHIAAFDPPTALKLLALWRAAKAWHEDADQDDPAAVLESELNLHAALLALKGEQP